MSISLDQIVAFLMGPFGTLFLALFIIYTGYKKLWVFGWYAQELKTRNERLENSVDRIAVAAKTVTSLVESATTTAEKTEVTS